MCSTPWLTQLQVADAPDDDEPPAPAAAPAPKKKKNKKKKGGKSVGTDAKPTDINEMSLEEMDALLASEAPKQAAARKGAAPPPQSATPDTPHAALRCALALDTSHLDPQHELKRQFGASAIKAYEREKQANHMPSRAGARGRGGAMYNSNTRARTVLCTPRATWPDLARTFVGLSMTVDDTPRGRLCSFKHSRAYRQAQFQFAQAVSSYDTNALVALWRVFPWHIDTLLQLADVSRYQGDLGQASDFIDRALFAMERSAAPPFTAGLTSSAGPPQVDFLRAENRALWLASHRNIDLFGRRGTWRTALEWCKLVLGFDTSDPHGVLLWIDFLAIKARQHTWLLTFLDALDAQRAASSPTHLDNVRAQTPCDDEKTVAQEAWSGTLDWSVGACFARALALRAVERDDNSSDHARSDAALRLAIARHPFAALLLAEKTGLDVPGEVSTAFPERGTYSATDPAFGELLAHLYVHRSQSLWKEAPLAAWFRDVAGALLPALVGARLVPGAADEDTRMGVYRHLVVADLPDALHQKLMRYLPLHVRNPPGGVESFDPVPPLYGTRYDDAYYSVTGAQRPSGADSLLSRVLGQLDDAGRAELLRMLHEMDAEGIEAVPDDDGDVDNMPGHVPETAAEPVAMQEEQADDEAVRASSEPQPPAEAPAPQPNMFQRAWNALWGSG